MKLLQTLENLHTIYCIQLWNSTKNKDQKEISIHKANVSK